MITDALNTLSSNVLGTNTGVLGAIITAFENVVGSIVDLF